jgi:hypothetical protein
MGPMFSPFHPFLVSFLTRLDCKSSQQRGFKSVHTIKKANNLKELQAPLVVKPHENEADDELELEVLML